MKAFHVCNFEFDLSVTRNINLLSARTPQRVISTQVIHFYVIELLQLKIDKRNLIRTTSTYKRANDVFVCVVLNSLFVFYKGIQ